MSTMIVEGIAAGPAELKTSKGGKTYAVLTILERVRTKRNGKWETYGENVIKVQVWGHAAEQVATYEPKTPVFAHIYDVVTRAWIGQDGNPYAAIYGTANMVGVRETRYAPKEEAKAIAAETADRKREERADADADADAQRQKTEQEATDKRKRAEQAEILAAAQKAKDARDAAKPQGTDETACRKCGENFQKRELTKAGHCQGCKQTRRPAAKRDAEPAAIA